MDLLIGFVENFLRDRHEDDAFDRLNYQITPFLFVLFSIINVSRVSELVRELVTTTGLSSTLAVRSTASRRPSFVLAGFSMRTIIAS